MEEQKCKECFKKLSKEEKIFDGYCEKCWNKWIKKKTTKPPINNKHSNENITGTFSFLCSIVSIGLIPIISILYFISVPFLFFNIITLFQSPELLEPINEISLVFLILVSISILFGILGIILGLISIKKNENTKSSTISIILSIISIAYMIILLN